MRVPPVLQRAVAQILYVDIYFLVHLTDDEIPAIVAAVVALTMLNCARTELSESASLHWPPAVCLVSLPRSRTSFLIGTLIT